MSNIAYQSHIFRMHACNAKPLSYSEWIYLAMHCISLNVHDYKKHGINRYINQK